MGKTVLDLLKSIETQRDFFKKEKESFVDNFVQEIQKNSKTTHLLSTSAIRTIGEKLYILLFLNFKKDPLKELYNFAYKVAENRIDLKSILISLTLKLIRDFIDHVLNANKEFNIVKDLILLIDSYLTQVEIAYAAHYQKIEDELHKIKNEKNIEQEEIILSILKKSHENKEKIDLLDFYKEVPITCKSPIKRVSEHDIVVDIQNCNFNIFKEDKLLYLKIPSFPKIVEAKILYFKEFDYVTLSHLKFTEIPQEKRKYIRVVPKEAIKVYITKNGNKAEGLINDISIGGIGVYTNSIDMFNKNDEVEIEFKLEEEAISTKGVVRYVTKESKRLGIEFIQDIEIENKIAKYVVNREFEIIKELRI